MRSDLDLAHSIEPEPIEAIAIRAGLGREEIELYGPQMAKISFAALSKRVEEGRRGKLVLVTAITPTKAGEGKTTVAIGLADGLAARGRRVMPALREPSLGPVFGMKGGATGGGMSQVLPMEDINLHFTGDMHAISSANNLLAASVDNHIHFGNRLGVDPASVSHRRALDMNDRGLRSIIAGAGGKENAPLLETGFNITAAAEVMAVLCLSDSIADLKARLGRIVVARSYDGEPVTASAIGVTGAMAALLRHAIKPNLVQTMAGTPAIVHGGPFANIAHGCSSVLSLKLALSLADMVVTEAGFGADLGFEKFCDIVAAPRAESLVPDAVVLIATIRALKLHGGVRFDELGKPDLDAIKRGLVNLESHAAIVSSTCLPFVVTVNKFTSDSQEEIDLVLSFCKEKGWPAAVTDPYTGGGDPGSLDLADRVLEALNEKGRFEPFYKGTDSLETKINSLSEKIYRAGSVEFSQTAERQLAWLEKHGFACLPVCVAKSQYSLTGNNNGNDTLHVRELRLSAGAGFIVAVTGEIMTMPGLPRHPAALEIDIDDQGEIVRLF
ncbi:MAG: formate--tetrahydrofolate ligase [Candidatus Melainabacteria bacterium]|nr:formate--tetrahydrofolate ligase [Candidatus Melainabacteria bacterium]